MLHSAAVRSDAALLDAWTRGDEAAGREIYRRYADRLTRFFARKVPSEVADLVQRTFLKWLEAAKEGGGFERPGAALFAIARNELYEAFKRRSKSPATFDPAVMSLEDLGTGPSQALARHEQQRLLLAALRRLPLDDQLAVELYYWEELAMEDVAQVLGATKSAAINRIHRARAALREKLTELDASPALLRDTATGLETWARSLREGADPP